MFLHRHLKKELPPLQARLYSIDVFRAITMFLMIFVNDAASLKEIPAWLGHADMNEDRLGFSDIIFPAFLFIVGLSLPFALRNRQHKGHSTFSLATYIALRSAALLIMGFFQVNMDRYAHDAWLPAPVWMILVTLSFFLIWLDYPPGLSRVRKYAGIATGILLLAIMAWLYQGRDGNGMSPSWWGILGLIGWAYLTCAGIWLLTNGRLLLLIPALFIATGINVTLHAGILHLYMPVIGDASSVTLVMAGMVVATVYAKLAAAGQAAQCRRLFMIAGILLLVAGWMIRPYAGGISKIKGTPAWVFLCTGMSMLVFMGLTWLIDQQQRQKLFSFIRPAGTVTLTCYLLPYLLYAVLWLAHFHYPAVLRTGTGGLLRSLLIAVLVVRIAGLLEKKHIRLHI